MIDFLKYLLKQIIDFPDDLKIDETLVENDQAQYLIHANKEDIGKIIGKQGKIIQAIRNVCKIIAIKQNKQIRIEIA